MRAIRPREPFCAHAAMPGEGEGAGLVEAARGSLGHWMQVRDGRIVNYQIVAPTTWNFSPRDENGASRRLRAGARRRAGARGRDRAGRRAAHRALVRSVHGLHGALNDGSPTSVDDGGGCLLSRARSGAGCRLPPHGLAARDVVRAPRRGAERRRRRADPRLGPAGCARWLLALAAPGGAPARAHRRYRAPAVAGRPGERRISHRRERRRAGAHRRRRRCGDLSRMSRGGVRSRQPALSLSVHQLHALRSAALDRPRDPLRSRHHVDGGLCHVRGLSGRVRKSRRPALPRATECLSRLRTARLACRRDRAANCSLRPATPFRPRPPPFATDASSPSRASAVFTWPAMPPTRMLSHG